MKQIFLLLSTLFRILRTTRAAAKNVHIMRIIQTLYEIGETPYTADIYVFRICAVVTNAGVGAE